MGFVYVAPPALPPSAVSPWSRMSHEWVGWDGSSWMLSDPKSGVFLTQEGVEGLAMPPAVDWVSPGSPGLHGQEFTGWVAEARPVFWPIFLFHDSGSKYWQERDTAFWRSLRRGEYGTWRVTTTAGTRELRCRFSDDGGHTFDRDPHYFGWASYGVSLMADDPFWKGPSVRRSWKQGDPVQFFGGALGKAPLFHIMSGSQLSTATMTNEGDVDAWPRWTVTGPLSSVSVGVGDAQVSWSGTLLEGQVLTIDSDPRDQTAFIDGVDVTADLGAYDFAPIPPGEDRSLSLTMSGTGTVTAEITPRYFRAW